MPGSEVPSLEIKILTSDKENAQISEWEQIAYVNQQTSLLFKRDVKRYLKFVVNFLSSSDLTEVNFLLLVQVQIENIFSPIISDHTRSILNRFPSWTKTFADSLERSTPELALPESIAGKFINALIADDLDKIDEFISKIELDSFINSANENEIAWMNLYTPVSPGFVKVIADGRELARVSTMKELLEHRITDNVFFYNFTTGSLYTVKQFRDLYVDTVEQKPMLIQTLNSFDEFGLKVGLQRLYLESNTNFAKRILDVGKNPPSINEQGLKLTLRRELDIWKAVGATPNSDYQGATPEIIEISDMNTMSKYFSKEGIPTNEFYNFVDYINNNYPSNLGYIKWGEAYWDYAGRRGEGVSSIPQITDSATPGAYVDIYQPGVGDFEDAKLKLKKVDDIIKKASFGLRLRGIKYDSYEKAYEPISIKYDSYLSYLENYHDHGAATVNYDVILKLNAHAQIPSNSVYTARYKDTVKNLSGLDSSPEYIVRPIFNSLGFTTGDSIYYNSGGTPYVNTFEPSATESYTFSQIPLYSVNEATISFIDSTNYLGATGNYGSVGFVDSTPYNLASSTKKTIVKTATQINNSSYNTNLKIGSNIYDPLKARVKNTPLIRSSNFGLNLNSDNDITKKKTIIFTPQDILKDIIVPNNVTPLYVHLDNVVEDSYDIDHSYGDYAGYGGVSFNRDTDQRHLLSASPNIIFSFINPNFSTPNQMPNYYETVGATVNYYFKDIKFPYNATPTYLAISSKDSAHYPFNSPIWENFSADSNSDIEFYYSDENGIVSNKPKDNYDVDYPSFTVGVFSFLRSDFGLGQYASSDNLIIKNIEVINQDRDDIDVYAIWYNDRFNIYNVNEDLKTNFSNDDEEATPYGRLNYLDTFSDTYILKNIVIYVTTVSDNTKPSINSGWYFQDQKERYIYSEPQKEIYVNQPNITLLGVARQGAPVIVSTQDANGSTVNYTQVAFANEASPAVFDYYNIEYIIPTYENYIALAYKDLFDLTIVDQFTGKTILKSENYTSNILDYTSSSTPMFNTNTEYKISYRVKNTFNIDNEYYDNTSNSHRSFIRLLSTPNYSYRTVVEYESAIIDDGYLITELDLNPLHSPIDEGFIYLSHSTYPLSEIECKLSPNQIIQGSKDFMTLNVFTKDVNQNPKPWTDVKIYGNNLLIDYNATISATPMVFETDSDGYLRTIIEHAGTASVAPLTNYVYVSDNTNSFSATASYIVLPNKDNSKKLSAEVTKKIINADGNEKQSIYGNATPNAIVYWRKARSLYEALNTSYENNFNIPGQYLVSGTQTADQNGNFKIESYIAQDDGTPGYWFVVVDSEFKQSPSANPVTIAGDIVYWYERYDVNQSNSSEPVLNAVAGSATHYYHYLTDPVFKKDQYTDKVYYEETIESPWNLPNWYPINRYTQYQMGLLGSTPYFVDSYNNLRPDYEEE